MRLALGCFAGVMALLLIGGAGGAARLLYPIVAVGFSVVLFLKARELYVDFVLWCWFLSPFLRRVMDYQAGWKDPSLVLLTPYIVVLVAPLCSWKRLSHTPLASVLPFIAASVAIVYGVALGLVLQPFTAMVVSLLGWATPVLFAWWLATTEEHDHVLVKRSIERSFVYGLLVTGVYGFIQFVVVPPWDSNWLIQLGSVSDATSMGVPEPFQLRVFSTLNSAGAFALIITAGLLLLTSVAEWQAGIAIVFGLGSLILTQGRSAWLGFGVGLILLSFRARKGVIRTLAIGAIAGFFLLPILLAGPAGEMIHTRFLSLVSIGGDVSAVERTRGFSNAVDLLMEHPAGLGIGVDEGVISNDGSYSLHDNGIVEALLTLGCIAGPVYLGSLLILAFTRIPAESTNAGFRTTSGVVALALLSQLPFGSVYLGAPGLFVWLFAAVAGYGDGLPLEMSPLRSDEG